MMVVDASVWVDLLCGALDRETRALVAQDLCVAPPHVDYEVGAALVRAERRELLPRGAAEQLIRAFQHTPCRREHDERDPVSALRFRDNATYADAWYLAMAGRLSCPVLTTDSGMAAAATMHGLEVVGAAPRE